MFHLLLLFLLVPFLPCSSSTCSNYTPVARKVFYHNGEQEQVRLLSSQQVESKLVSSVFMILARELLGYDISLVQNQQSVVKSEENTAIQLKLLASCTNPLCNGFNSGPESSSTPRALLTLDMVLPPSHHVDTWGLLDAGQLGPAVRYFHESLTTK